jgi:hypothetical protein
MNATNPDLSEPEVVVNQPRHLMLRMRVRLLWLPPRTLRLLRAWRRSTVPSGIETTLDQQLPAYGASSHVHARLRKIAVPRWLIPRQRLRVENDRLVTRFIPNAAAKNYDPASVEYNGSMAVHSMRHRSFQRLPGVVVTSLRALEHGNLHCLLLRAACPTEEKERPSAVISTDKPDATSRARPESHA